MITKQQALATAGSKQWTIRNTRYANQFSKNDTLDIVLDASGNFEKVVHTSGASSLDLVPDVPPADCVFIDGDLTISFLFNGGVFDFWITFMVSDDPIKFSYGVDSTGGAGGPGERGGGD